MFAGKGTIHTGGLAGDWPGEEKRAGDGGTSHCSGENTENDGQEGWGYTTIWGRQRQQDEDEAG